MKENERVLEEKREEKMQYRMTNLRVTVRGLNFRQINKIKEKKKKKKRKRQEFRWSDARVDRYKSVNELP